MLLICPAVALVALVWLISRHITAARQARAALTPGKEYRIDEIRDQLEQLQRILKEVE